MFVAHFLCFLEASPQQQSSTGDAAADHFVFDSHVAFKMYDLDDDNKISRDELLAVLHMMVGANISDEQLASIADRTIMEADKDGDNMISFEEFCATLDKTDVEEKMSIRFLN